MTLAGLHNQGCHQNKLMHTCIHYPVVLLSFILHTIIIPFAGVVEFPWLTGRLCKSAGAN